MAPTTDKEWADELEEKIKRDVEDFQALINKVLARVNAVPWPQRYYIDDASVEKMRKHAKTLAESALDLLEGIYFPVTVLPVLTTLNNNVRDKIEGCSNTIKGVTSDLSETWTDDAGNAYVKRSGRQSDALIRARDCASVMEKQLDKLRESIADLYHGVRDIFHELVGEILGIIQDAAIFDVLDAASLGAKEAAEIVLSALRIVNSAAKALNDLVKKLYDTFVAEHGAKRELTGLVESRFPDGWPKAVSETLLADA
ncbi:hypothetical protein ABN028_10860 [Actinopolymorpha sp. B17G11]|uniref:hypothetical protein n=1 Tax=Actinopolymorpha sp. B17G11 TaxID=3160861 RepID=UPI0032E4247D